MMQGIDTFQVAERLLNETAGEAEYRAAASRAYFAAFQHTIAQSTALGFNRERSANDHQNIVVFLKKAKTRNTLHRCGSHLAQLRRLRNAADYELDETFSLDFAQRALDLATDIIFDILPSPTRHG